MCHNFDDILRFEDFVFDNIFVDENHSKLF